MALVDQVDVGWGGVSVFFFGIGERVDEDAMNVWETVRDWYSGKHFKIR